VNLISELPCRNCASGSRCAQMPEEASFEMVACSG
jgi:hypothetical protein